MGALLSGRPRVARRPEHLRGGTTTGTATVLPYEMAVGLGTLVYGFIALVLIYRFLRQYFSSALALWTTLILCCGTFLLWYLTVENSMVHGTSLFATTLFLYQRWTPGIGTAG